MSVRLSDLTDNPKMKEAIKKQQGESIPSSLLRSDGRPPEAEALQAQADRGRSRGVQRTITAGQFVVGIDPGDSTGLAIRDVEEDRFVEMELLSFWEVIPFVMERYTPAQTTIRIEDPNQVSPVYTAEQVIKNAGGLSWSTAKRGLKIARNVGHNQKEAELLLEKFEDLGYTTDPVKPTSSKWDADHFQKMTGYPTSATPNNQHVRDAGKLTL